MRHTESVSSLSGIRWVSFLSKDTHFFALSPVPLLLLSYDFHLLASDLSTDHYVCLFDFPGYGFSDKPLKGYTYTLRDDARLVDFFVQQIVSLQRFALLTHDRGDSVGLALLAGFPAYRQQTSPLTHHLLTNGNIYLPLANLTDFQQALRDPQTSQTTAAAVTAYWLATTSPVHLDRKSTR